MAATKDKYSKNTLNDQNTTVAGVTTPQIYALMPLALTEYVSDFTFKSNFFCHDVWHKTDTDGKECVIGLLDTRAGVTDSHYQQLHADKRKGKLRLTKNGVNYTVLNDGGLNTKPFVEMGGIDFCAENLISFHLAYQNAYWENTTTAIATLKHYRNDTLQSTRTMSLSDMPKVRATSSASFYVVDQDTINAIAPSEGDEIRISVAVTNDEGTYTSLVESIATVGPRIEFIRVYKIDGLPNPLTDDPTQGDIYKCLVKPEYWASVSSGDDGYPNLKNLFATAKATRVNTTVYLRGFTGNAIPSSLLDTPLPAGMYYGFPETTPFVDVDPPQGDKIVYVEAVSGDAEHSGHAYMWNENTYTPPTPPTPVVPLTFTDFTIAFSRTGTYTSYGTVVNNDYTMHLWPTITVSANGAGQGSFHVELVWIEEGSTKTEVIVWSKDIYVAFTAAGTQTIQQVSNSETQGEEAVPETQVGCIDTSFTSQSRMNIYSYRFQITAIDSNSQLDGVTLPVETLEVVADDFIQTN